MKPFAPQNLGMLALTALLALACSSCVAPKEVHVVLLGGQSNMMGKGVYAELDRTVRKRLDVASRRVLVSSAGRRERPLSFKSSERHVREFGPELFIGLTLAERFPDRHYLLIKTAVGGTSLNGAWNPEWSQEKAMASESDEKLRILKLYRVHQKSIARSLGRLRGGEDRYRFVGMAWMQGESDSRNELSAVSYEANLKNLIDAYRKDLSEPELPFVFGQVNSPFYGKAGFQGGLETVRLAMLNVTRTVDHTAMIPTSTDPSWPDFPKLDDDVHYNTEGQRSLGVAFAGALIRLNGDE